VILGTSVAAKHTFMAYMLNHLAERHRPAWPLSELELRLCRAELAKGFEADTTRYETPGRVYTLARTLILHGRGRTLWVFHNLLNNWLASEEEMQRNAPSWDRVGGMVIVIDGDRLARPESRIGDHAAELYSRTVRHIEEFCLLSPGELLPMRVAVVVACSTRQMMSELLARIPHAEGEAVKNAVMSHDPALHALLVRTVDPQKLKFWGWVAPSEVGRIVPSIAQDVGFWIMAK
jgi:hypothetical protein